MRFKSEQDFMAHSWIKPDDPLYKERIEWGYRMGHLVRPPITSNKIGRNDPCPCGSKKKYKKCCFNT